MFKNYDRNYTPMRKCIKDLSLKKNSALIVGSQV
jgi:hypothetical protein